MARPCIHPRMIPPRARAPQPPQLHPYTFRNEAYRLTYGSFSAPETEYERYFVHEGIDGAFTDFSRSLKAYFDSKSGEVGRKWVTSNINRNHQRKSKNPKHC